MDRAKKTILRLFIQLAILIFFYSLCRLVLVYADKNEFDFSNPVSTILVFVFGLRFDLSAIVMTNSLFIVLTLLPVPFILNRYYQGFLKLLFILSNSFFILLNLIDVAYFPFTHKRMQFDAFLFLNGAKGNDFFYLLPTFLLQYWLLWLLYILMIPLLIISYNRTTVIKHIVPTSFKNYLYSSLIFLISIVLSIIAIRGGLQLKPLSIIHAAEMTEVRNIPAILNTPFSVINTFNKRILPEIKYFRDDQLKECFNGVHIPVTNESFQKQNVVVIIVESLSKKYVGFFNGQAKTPFLDSLFSQSMVFTNGFANGKESIQGIPAILSSIPSWQYDPFIFSTYSADKIPSMANILKKEDYQSSFFHGGSNGTMGFNSYCKLAEFDDYYGRNEYNNEKDNDGHWGIWDEPFLQFMVEKLSATPQPFVSAVFTLNPHHPFTIPEKYNEMFGQNRLPVLSCVQYVDFALARFFEKAKNTTWFNHTLFIITADHTAPKTDGEINPALDDYRIPIVFYKPDGTLKGIDRTIANQIDILPSIMHLLNYPYPFFSFGNDLFGSQCDHFSINFNSGIYQYIDSTYCYQFNGQNGIGLYNWQTDSLYKKNLYPDHLKDVYYEKCDENLKKMIQLFSSAMVNNKMQLPVNAK